MTHHERAVEGSFEELQPRGQQRFVHLPGAALAFDSAIGEVARFEELEVVLSEGRGLGFAHLDGGAGLGRLRKVGGCLNSVEIKGLRRCLGR